MHTAIKRLFDHIGRSEEAKGYLNLAMETFFGDLAGDHGPQTLQDVEEFLGSDAFGQIYPVMLEFFFTNIYGDGEGWNVIDSFLESPRGKKIPENDRAYLAALRPSVMSVYEVTDIEPGKGMMVKDMARGGAPVRIREKSLTRYVAQWECVGLRVMDMGGHFEIAGGCVRLERAIAEDLAPWLKMMRDMTVATLPLQDTSIPSDKISHYAEVMWASEIGMAWMDWLIESRGQEMPQLANSEGHIISPVAIRFSFTGEKADIAKILNKHSEFEQDAPDEWIWLEKPKGRKKAKKIPQTIRGRIMLCDDAIELDVNSRERGDILEDMIGVLLGDLAGPPEREDIEELAGSIEAFLASIPDDSGDEVTEDLSKKEKADIIHAIKDAHYRQWIKGRIPALDNKTPRMALKTKKGKAELISLLKEIENNENHCSASQGVKPYDMRWVWDELGLDREAA